MTDMYIEGRKICVEQKNIHKNNLYYEWLGRENVVDRHCCLFFSLYCSCQRYCRHRDVNKYEFCVECRSRHVSEILIRVLIISLIVLISI